jgi:hypothetical protein
MSIPQGFKTGKELQTLVNKKRASVIQLFSGKQGLAGT